MVYLRGHFILEDEKEEKKMSLQARNYAIINKSCIEGASTHRY